MNSATLRAARPALFSVCGSTLLSATLIAACDGDGAGGSDDPCGDADDLRQAAVTDFCEDETEHCCYCRCWDDTGGHYDPVELVTNASCVCQTPPPSPGDCSGDALEAAEHCLADEDSCAAVEVLVAEALCADSPL